MSYFILVLFVLRAIKPRQLLFDIKYIFLNTKPNTTILRTDFQWVKAVTLTNYGRVTHICARDLGHHLLNELFAAYSV